MYIISYDVASKSLAMSILYFNDNWKDDLKKIKENYHNEMKTYSVSKDLCECLLRYLDKLEQLVDGLIVPKVFDVVDLIPGKKLKEVDVITRTTRLRAYLHMIDYYIHGYKFHDLDNKELSVRLPEDNQKYKVLLEYQMGPNDKSRNVCSQILYHYANMNANFVHSNEQNGSRKAMLNMKPVINYDIEIIGPSLKNKINLDKDKPHTFFMQKYTKSYDANKAHSKSNLLCWVKFKKCEELIKGVKKKNLDDIADSVTMTLAWIYLKSGLL